MTSALFQKHRDSMQTRVRTNHVFQVVVVVVVHVPPFDHRHLLGRGHETASSHSGEWKNYEAILGRVYRYPECFWWVYRTVSGTGVEVIPNVPKCRVLVLRAYRTYRNVGYRYRARTEYPYSRCTLVHTLTKHTRP